MASVLIPLEAPARSNTLIDRGHRVHSDYIQRLTISGWSSFFVKLMTFALLFKSNHCGSWSSILCQYVHIVQNVHPPAKACNWLWSLRNAQKVQLMHSFFKSPPKCNFTMESVVQWDAMYYSAMQQLFHNFTAVQFYYEQFLSAVSLIWCNALCGSLCVQLLPHPTAVQLQDELHYLVHCNAKTGSLTVQYYNWCTAHPLNCNAQYKLMIQVSYLHCIAKYKLPHCHPAKNSPANFSQNICNQVICILRSARYNVANTLLLHSKVTNTWIAFLTHCILHNVLMPCHLLEPHCLFSPPPKKYIHKQSLAEAFATKWSAFCRTISYFDDTLNCTYK